MEHAKYNIDIAALCESPFSESGSLNDLEYSYFWSGKLDGERMESGVDFAIKKDIVTKLTEMLRPVSDRIVTMRLPLSKDNLATIISVFATTMINPDENKEVFYNQMASVRKTTWLHPRSRHLHMNDFIITRCRDKMDFHSTRAKRGAKCWIDHQMLRSKVAFRIRQKHNRQETSKTTKVQTAKLATGKVLSR